MFSIGHFEIKNNHVGYRLTHISYPPHNGNRSVEIVFTHANIYDDTLYYRL